MWCRSQTADLPISGARFQIDRCDRRSGEGNHWLNPKSQNPNPKKIPKSKDSKYLTHASPSARPDGLIFWIFPFEIFLGFGIFRKSFAYSLLTTSFAFGVIENGSSGID